MCRIRAIHRTHAAGGMGKWLTMVVMLVGCLVLGDDPDIVLFLPSKIYGAGVFCSCLNPNRCKAVEGNCMMVPVIACDIIHTVPM